jgi:hydrogenase maturation protease
VLDPRDRRHADARAARRARGRDPRGAFPLTPALVVGIGNTTRRDDAAGVVVAERVARLCPDADVVVVQQLVPEIAERMAEADVVVFVDASVRVAEVEESDVEPDPSPAGTHVSSPGVLLAMCEALYGRRPERVVLLEIPARSFEFGETLSERTSEALHEAVERVLELIEGCG